MNSDDVIQLIFCVESTEKAATDKWYINEVLKSYFNVGENKISYVYMGGKHNYNNRSTINKINKLTKEYQLTGSGKTYVIYVFDKDQNNQDSRDSQFEKDVKTYCKELGYKLIWFVKTVEEVMWGSKIKKQFKRTKALEFIRKDQIKNIKKKNLEAHDNVNSPCKSNILTVLNGFRQICLER
ncbi:MAG: hypothetical protein PHF62_03385 [Acholeplasmataceae bacterium]|nr:hypothetical protein [Acholeplasmataceae bacterium]